MRICFLVSSLGAGGAERVAMTLCNAWSARGDDIVLVSTFSGGGRPFYRASDCVELIHLSDLVGIRNKNFVSYARRFLALRRLISTKAPDIIISFLPNVNVAAILAGSFFKAPLIICERDDPSSRRRFEFWEICARLVYRYADMLTVQTESVELKIRNFYPGLDKVRVVPNPLSEDIFKYKRRTGSARKILLSMGRLAPQKQVEKTVDAFSVVATGFKDWDLLIYGEGPLRPALERQIEAMGLSDRIFLKGKTNEPWSVMSGADAFVMTSKHEGFPNALLEAMGVGLPCIVFDCPSGPREISRNGKDAILVPLNDHEGLVSALVTLMGSEELRKSIGKQARESVRGRFSLHGIIKKWDELFEELTAVG